MKKGNYHSNTSANANSCDKGGNFGGGRKLRRRLSGRENPNAAGLDVGDYDLLDGGRLISSLSELRVKGSALPTPPPSAGRHSKVDAASAKEATSTAFSASSMSSSAQANHHGNDDAISDIELVESKGNNFASLAACHPEVQYDDPGVALDLSDDSDSDDDDADLRFLGNANYTNEKIEHRKSLVSITCTDQKRNTAFSTHL